MVMLTGLVKSLNLKDKKVKIDEKEFLVVGKAANFLATKVNAGDQVEFLIDKMGNLTYIKCIGTNFTPAGGQGLPSMPVVATNSGEMSTDAPVKAPRAGDLLETTYRNRRVQLAEEAIDDALTVVANKGYSLASDPAAYHHLLVAITTAFLEKSVTPYDYYLQNI